MLVTVVLLSILVVLLLVKVADIGERLSHLEGHVCAESDDDEGDEDDVDGADAETPVAAPEPKQSDLRLKVN